MRILLIFLCLSSWAWAQVEIEAVNMDFNPRHNKYTLTVKIRNQGNTAEPPIKIQTYIRRDSKQMWQPFKKFIRDRRLPPRIRDSYSLEMNMDGPEPHPLLKEGKFELRAEAAAKDQSPPHRKETSYP